MCTFALNYVDDCNNIRLFCSSVWNQQTDGSAGNERDLLPCQPKVAMVYGGLWYDWGFDIGGNVCECPWYGDAVGDDLYADVPGLYPGLFCSGIHPIAALLQAESDNHLRVLGAAIRTEGL